MRSAMSSQRMHPFEQPTLATPLSIRPRAPDRPRKQSRMCMKSRRGAASCQETSNDGAEMPGARGQPRRSPHPPARAPDAEDGDGGRLRTASYRGDRMVADETPCLPLPGLPRSAHPCRRLPRARPAAGSAPAYPGAAAGALEVIDPRHETASRVPCTG